MITSSVVTVTDTATALNSPVNRGIRVALRNGGAGTINIGDSGVTDGAGFELPSGGILQISIGPDAQLFAISAATASNDVQVLIT